MSWNARRFAIAVNDQPAVRNAVALWLTADAIDRIGSALKHETLNLAEAPPFPDEGLILGFASPHTVKDGSDAYVCLVRPGGVEGGAGATHTHVCLPSPTISDLPNAPLGRGLLGVRVGAGFYMMDQRIRVIDKHLECVIRTRLDVAPWVSLGDSPSALRVQGIGADLTPDEERANARERAVVRYFAHAAWALLHEPVEREVSATVLVPSTIRTGKGRRAEDVSVSVIDVRRSTTTRSAPSGRVIEHDHRWTRRGHWRMQPFGKGRTERRRVWIDEVVCGPPDKPLIRRPKVSVLR